MEQKQYFEAVLVSELPPVGDTMPLSDHVLVWDKTGDYFLAYYDHRIKLWFDEDDNNVDDIVSWLRPIKLSDLIKEEAGKADKLINNLLLFAEDSGEIIDGFRVREIVLEMKQYIQSLKF